MRDRFIPYLKRAREVAREAEKEIDKLQTDRRGIQRGSPRLEYRPPGTVPPLTREQKEQIKKIDAQIEQVKNDAKADVKEITDRLLKDTPDRYQEEAKKAAEDITKDANSILDTGREGPIKIDDKTYDGELSLGFNLAAEKQQDNDIPPPPGDDIPPPGDGDGPQPEPDQPGPEQNGPDNDQGLTVAFNDVAENKEASTVTGQDLSQDQEMQQTAQKSKFVDMAAYGSANKDVAPVDQNMDTTAQQQDVGDTVDKTGQEDVNEDKDPGQVQSRFFDAQALKEEQKQIEQAEQSKETTEPEDKALQEKEPDGPEKQPQEERPDFSDIRDSIGQDEIGEQDRDTSPEQSLDDRTGQEIDQEHEVDELGRQGQEEQPDFSDIRNSIGMDGFDDQSLDMDNSPDQEGPDMDDDDD